MGLLRKLFGPTKREVWEQLCKEIDARYINGGIWKGEKVQASHGQWTITLDIYVVSTGKSAVSYTRLRAPFVNPDGFRFTIYRRNWFADIGKKLGMQDVEVGHPDFDRDFIIKGTDEAKLRALFANPRLRELINAQRDLSLTVFDSEGYFGPKFPADTDELNFTVYGVITDVERLKSLFELFAEALDQLCHIGSAYETKPDVEL